MILQLGLQFILPVFLLVSLWRGRYNRRVEWLHNVMAVGAVFLFLFLTARWDFTSYYLRYLLPVLLAGAAYLSYRRQGEFLGRYRGLKLLGLLLNIAVLVLFLGLSLVVLWGHKSPEGALQLAFPLQEGTYYIGGGGNTRFLNNHQAHEPQKFALDIVRLNRLGNRASGRAPKDLARYPIFGDTVYSPCRGTVISVVDGLPDLVPPQEDSQNTAGNHVVLECQEVQLVLAHLKQGTTAVKAGVSISEGEAIGQVGNSGQSSQPHLHLHAERGGRPGHIFEGEGVPIKLDGRFLVRNDRVKSR